MLSSMGQFSLAILLLASIAAVISGTKTSDFDDAIHRFLDDHGYTGASVTAVKDGRLILAKGYGVTRDGAKVKPWSRLPVTRVSQSLTAVAVLKLVQQGLLGVDDKVFGKTGVLRMIQPLHPHQQDPRVNDITVGHLLRHSAGWDSSKAPLYDPVLNEVYKARGHDVPDIAAEMKVDSPVDAYSLISYVISQPLQYTPGTRVRHSNLGYVVLGRVLEETTKLMYEDYVKKFVLNPCGMWHTRLWLPSDMKTDSDSEEESEGKDKDDSVELRDILDPLSMDSALGWSSTALDMARLMRCVFDQDYVLNDHSIELLLQQEDSDLGQTPDTWLCSGFTTNTLGEVWQDGDPHGDDVIVYHDLLGDRQGRDGKGVLPDTWVLQLHGSHLHRLRHKSRDLFRYLKGALRDDSPSQGLTVDLSDVSSGTHDMLIKFRVDEHHLDAYVNAVKSEGYDVTWVSPYTHRRHTSFIVISRRQPYADFRLEHGLSEKQLLSRKLQQERRGYNLTFLQSYQSQSHQDGYNFLAVYHRHAYSGDTQLKYGTDHLPEPYDRLVQMYREKHFHPLVQSVLPHRGDREERFSFVFVHSEGGKPVNFTNFYHLSPAELDDTLLLNAEHGRVLSFLDAYTMEGEPLFAAVFSNATHPRWTWEAGLEEGRAREVVQTRLTDGLWPAIAVAYTEEGALRFSLFLRSDHSSVPLTHA